MVKKGESLDIKNPFEAISWHLRGYFGESLECQLLGKVLTIIDGAISNERQNKAIKDTIKMIFGQHSDREARYLIDIIYQIAENQGQKITSDEEPQQRNY